MFEEQSLPDPTRLSVAASDRTSGLAAGRIQMRRVGPVSARRRVRHADTETWRDLSTAREGDRYHAQAPWLDVEAGVYEFRALVSDLAGNQAVADALRSGRHVRYVIVPGERFGDYVRLEDRTWVRIENHREASTTANVFDGEDVGTVPTSVAVGILRRTRISGSSRRCSKLQSRAARRRCVRKRRRRGRIKEELVHTANLGFGKRATVRGTLATQDGAPIANAHIDVYATPDHLGGAPQKVATVTTNATGSFTYTTARGPSRRLTFAFDDGPGEYRRSSGEVRLRVKGAATLRANRHSVRNGETVRFSGRLLGRPIPPRGKVVDLQAHYRGKWRTFATPRAKSNGMFRFRYRFEATRGRVTYRFRARVRAEAAYPYELGYSRTVRVSVRG